MQALTISPLLRWARWGALGVGICYGILRNRKVHAIETRRLARLHKEAVEAKKKEDAWQALLRAAGKLEGPEEFDFSGPDFDLEKYMIHLEKVDTPKETAA